MTDKELLELAAKAAKIPYTKPTEDYDGSLGLAVGSNPMRTMTWNPLTDDGDALRLAVKLEIAIYPTDYEKKPSAQAYWPNSPGASAPHNNDPYAATRRAIVKAAAEIGKEMKCKE